MERYANLFAAWQAVPHSGVKPSEWPPMGIAIEGDFSGIQRFVLRPVPGASGAARRLRARSFSVLALTRIVADKVVLAFTSSGSSLFYAAGGRFLVVANNTHHWENTVRSLQVEIDQELLKQYGGELAFHLAAAPFSDGKIPVAALNLSMTRRKENSLGHALQSQSFWNSDVFASTESSCYFRCSGCDMTQPGTPNSENLCRTCVSDRDFGAQMLRTTAFRIKQTPQGALRLLGTNYAFSNSGIAVPAITHAPLIPDGSLATFEDLAARAIGRPYLGYLHIDADRIGEQFRSLDGNPLRTRALSQLLQSAFSDGVSTHLRQHFPNIYPVYGGGDDLFVIGPWDQVLDFAAAFRDEFRSISGSLLTFSAGMALARKRQHILTKSEEAEFFLNSHAKRERDSIHALGTTIPWSQFEDALRAARQLSNFQKNGRVRSALIRDILQLHARSASDPRSHALLTYQIERNLKENNQEEERKFLSQLFLQKGGIWPFAGFAARYSMLISGSSREE